MKSPEAAPAVVQLVAGGPGGGKSEWIAVHAAGDASVLGFVNRRTRELPNLLAAPAGCPCCTARVALQVVMARELRRRQPARVYIEIGNMEHVAGVERVLREWPLSQYLAIGPMVLRG